ncbi:16S rRNA (uracil(1498)-N(3))-methyltransferase [Pseudactinotalea suaedae]|uniref:16S rRNA (uracil(1498)-N(3))-methyltransferase n=1 Tax=Pseudactinotalea suaedae TaxID=1524924 RepID=UPI0012E12C40|nr:16S rRNA (uracil(1498)-N(3))-methyltransferase [Pseudactinotalea suaedae]
MTAPVFVVDPGAMPSTLGPGDTWTLTGPEARHAATVQRLRAGEPIEVVDGAGTRLRGEVAEGSGPAAVEISVLEVSHEEPPSPRLVLVQALAKGGRDEMAVEAATELGVDAVRPWQSARSVVQWRGDKAAKGEQRWRALVQAASKVARRSWLPEVLPFVRGDALVDVVAEAAAAGAVVLVLHEVASTPLVQVPLERAREVLIVIGPEGGISDDEVDALVGAGGSAVLLGPNVLRSSTAGPAALAVLAARTGRWT